MAAEHNELQVISIEPMFMEKYDEDHSDNADVRYIGIGKTKGTIVIVTCYA